MSPVADAPDAGIPPREVERRLEELRALFRLGVALRSVRFVDEPSAVHEEAPKREAPPTSPTRDA